MRRTDVVTHSSLLPASIPESLVSEFARRLNYLSEDVIWLGFDPALSNRVEFQIRGVDQQLAEVISGRIRTVASQLLAASEGFQPKVLTTRRPSNYKFKDNPREMLIKAGHLHEFGPGRIGLGPFLSELQLYFYSCLARQANLLGATRYQFPTLIDADVLRRCRYLNWFPHLITMASHLRGDFDLLERFSREFRVSDGRLQMPADAAAPCECLLSPSVCFHYYAWLKDKKLEGPKTITASGRCFRYEGANMESLERLWEFTMHEVIFVGGSEYVLAQRARALDITKELLEEWQLGYEIVSASDPVFVAGYSKQTSMASETTDLKFEIRVDLPYAPGTSLAVGSSNYHKNFFGHFLGIESHSSKEPAYAGCVAFGIERLSWAFLSQHGPDPEGWPLPARSFSPNKQV